MTSPACKGRHYLRFWEDNLKKRTLFKILAAAALATALFASAARCATEELALEVHVERGHEGRAFV